VTANFRLRLRSTKRSTIERCKYNTTKLSDPSIQEQFNIELNNRFEPLYNQKGSDEINIEIENRYEALHEAVKETSEKILGKRRKTKQPSWVTEETLKLLECESKAKSKYKSTGLAKDKKRWLALQNTYCIRVL
jgi:hypothetical protein